MRPRIVALAWLLVVLLVSACGLAGGTTVSGTLGEVGEQLDACEAAFRDASDGSIETWALKTSRHELDPAIRVCSSVAALAAASRLYPEVLKGVPSRMVVENRCATGNFSSSPICRELGIP